MADQEKPNQERVSDALIASGAVVPFEQLTWTDFPLETRLRALRFLLSAVARRREKRLAETQGQISELKAA